MYTRFLGPAALGFFMGCAPQPPLKSSHNQNSQPTIEPNFDHYSLAYEPYQMLLARGVRPADMDRGCTLIDRKGPDAKIEVKFANDGTLEPCEVEETAVNLWERFPEITEIIGQGPVPWRIQNPETLKRIREAIKVLNEDLVASGLKKDSEEYVKRRMLGLYVFAGLTDRLDQLEMIAREAPQVLEQIVKPLQDKGLIRFRAHLLQQGGLGLAQMTEDAPVEASADEALRTKKGWCTEQSKILYAVFREAGLKPFFVDVSMEDVLAVIKMRTTSLSQGKYTGHVYLGVPLQDKVLFADITLRTLFVEYPHSISLGLIHYLAYDLSNLGADLSETGRLEEGIKLLMVAVHLDPMSGDIRDNLGLLLYQVPGRLDEAIRLLREATQLEPGDILTWNNLGRALVNNKKFDAAKKVLEEGIRLHPKSSRLYTTQGLLYFNQGDSLADEESFRLSTIAYQEALKLDPSNVKAYEGLGIAYDRLSRLDDAIAVLEEGLSLNPNNSLLVNLLASLRRKREAAQRKSP